MPPKADKLQQNIESIKSFLNRKLSDYGELGQIISKVSKIEALLSEKKLTLQIVGNQENLIQAMFDLIIIDNITFLKFFYLQQFSD